MVDGKTKCTCRIVFSVFAILEFIVFSICMNLMRSYYSYDWGIGVAVDFILLIPFLTLFILFKMEQSGRTLDVRRYSTGFFASQLILMVFLYLLSKIAHYSLLLDGLWNAISVVLVARIAILFLLPRMKKLVLDIYSFVMVSFLCYALAAIVRSEWSVMMESTIAIMVALAFDLIFHVVLYFNGGSVVLEGKKQAQ